MIGRSGWRAVPLPASPPVVADRDMSPASARGDGGDTGMRPRSTATLLGLLLTLLLVPSAHAAGFVQTNLVSDVPGLASHTDANLKNPWGVALSSTSPFWVSNQVTGVATVFDGTGAPLPLVVAVPGGNPTGQAFNG